MNKLYKILDPRTPLPPGEYFIGDPCYVLPNSEWMTALEETNYFNLFPDAEAREHNQYNPKRLMNGVFSKLGILFAVSATEYGDGCYPVEDEDGELHYGAECGVDAGMIGAIPIDLVDKKEVEKYRDGLEGLGCIRTFDRSFRIGYSGGTISFGPVSINTGDDD